MINETIEAQIKKEQAERKNRKSSGKFKPSSYGMCYRRQYWERLGEEPTNPPDMKTLRTFLMGNLVHEYVEGLFSAAQRECEMTSDDEHGFADLITDNCAWDIKTVGSFAFKYVKPLKDESEPDYKIRLFKKKKNNILQVTRYGMYFLKPQCALAFINKDNFEVVHFFWETKTVAPEVEKELDTLCYHWREKILPEAVPRAFLDKDGKSKECGYCNFENKCKGKAF